MPEPASPVAIAEVVPDTIVRTMKIPGPGKLLLCIDLVTKSVGSLGVWEGSYHPPAMRIKPFPASWKRPLALSVAPLALRKDILIVFDQFIPGLNKHVTLTVLWCKNSRRSWCKIGCLNKVHALWLGNVAGLTM